MPNLNKHGLLLLFGLLASGAASSQTLLDRPVDFTCTGLPLPAALDLLGRQTGIGIAYSPDFFGGKPPEVSLFFKKERLGKVLDAMLEGTPAGFRVVENQVVLFQKNIPSELAGKPTTATFAVSGYVTDSASGERLLGATVFDIERRLGATTNEFGFFSLKLPPGRAKLRFSYLGFGEKTEELVLTKPERMKVGLGPGGALPMVTVFSQNDTFLTEPLPSNLDPDLPLNAARNLPNLGGEADLGRLAMLLPGVTTGADGLGGVHVRGGDADHTLVIFDDVPVYYGTHALGMFTVFNPDVVLSAKLWKGEIPARYGGRIGSVLDVRTKDGNLNRTETEVSLGLLSNRISLQLPLVKQKMSLLLTGRHSDFAPEMRSVSKKAKREKGQTGETIYRFYDINAKLNWDIGGKNRIYASFYQGRDELNDDERQVSLLAGGAPATAKRELTYTWQNQFAAFRWNHVWGDRLFSNLTLTKSRFEYRNHYFFRQDVAPKPDSSLLLVFQQLDYLSQVKDVSGRLDFDFFPRPAVRWKFGGVLSRRDFVPGAGERREFELPDSALRIFLLRPDTVGGFEGAAFFENSWEPNPRFSVRTGLRGSFFAEKKVFYPNIEPRASVRWRPAPGFLVKTSAAFTAQYLHVLRGWDVGTPADLWVPVTKKLAPQRGFQAEVGVEKTFDRRISASLTGFYNRTTGLEEWKSSVLVLGDRDALLGNDLENKTNRGRGRSRGIEAIVSGSAGGFSGWIGYTWSDANRQFDSLNRGRAFPFRYDRRHQVSAVLAQKLNDFTDLTVAATFATGDAITNDTTSAVAGQPAFLDLNIAYKIQTEDVNNLRLPNYSRLDAGLNFQLPARPGRDNRLTLGVYNILNHINARYSYLKPDGTRQVLPGLAPLPYVNFSAKF